MVTRVAREPKRVDSVTGDTVDIIDEDEELVQGNLTRAEAEETLRGLGFGPTSTKGLWSCRGLDDRGRYRKIVPHDPIRSAPGAD